MANILNTLKTAIGKGEIYVLPNGKTVTTDTVIAGYRKRYMVELKAGNIPGNKTMTDIFNGWLEAETLTVDLYNAICEVLNTPEAENNEPQEEKENAVDNEDSESAANPGDAEPADSTENPV